MKLTAVVPFYNVESYLGDCLESIVRQSLRDFEVILVDDGSPDGSRAIAEEYVARDPRFRIVTQANAGLGPARNTGMAEAKGDYLTFVDSDDVVPPDAWRTMVQRLDRSGSDFAAGRAQRFNVHGERRSWVHYRPFADDRTNTTVRDFPELANDRMVWNKVYRRSFWEKHGFSFPPILYEDYPVTLATHLAAESVEVVGSTVYLWRERDTGEKSITQRVFELRNIDDRVASDLMVLGLVAATDTPRAVRAEVHRHFIQTDVITVARAAALAPAEDRQAVLARAQELARALCPEVVAERGRFERILIALVLAGDTDGLRHMVDILDSRAPTPSNTLVDGRRTAHFDGVDPARVPADVLTLAEDDLQLLATVSAASWSGSRLRLSLSTRISFTALGDSPTVQAWLRRRRGRGARVPATVLTQTVDGNDLRAQIEVDASELIAAGGQRWDLWLELTAENAVRRGTVSQARGTALRGAAFEAGEGRWVMAGLSQDVYALELLEPAAWITVAEPGYTGEIRISGRSREPLPTVGVTLELTDERDVIVAPVSVDPRDLTRWDTHIQLRALATHHGELPVTATTTSFLTTLVTSDGVVPVKLLPSSPRHRFTSGGRDVQVSGGIFHGARFDESDHQFVVEGYAATGSTIRLDVLWYGDPTDAALELRWFRRPDDPDVLRYPLDLQHHRASVLIDAAEAAEVMQRGYDAAPETVESRDTEQEWVLFFNNAERLRTARLAETLLRQLPEPVATQAGEVRLANHHGFAGRLVVTGLGRT